LPFAVQPLEILTRHFTQLLIIVHTSIKHNSFKHSWERKRL